MSSSDAPTKSEDQEEKKLFFTTTDLLNKINTVLRVQEEQLKASSPPTSTSDAHQSQQDQPQFELQRRLPDGSTRNATNTEKDYADFQAKLKQAGQIVISLPPEEKLQWAEMQRQEGNKLYSKMQYKEAMDVYLTCLVAIDKSCHDPISGNSNISTIDWAQRVEQDVKLPVLLNLSACTLSLGMFKKTCAFCDLALDLRIDNPSPKLYFRRGRARVGLGLYCEAKEDLIMSMDILQRQEHEKGNKQKDNKQTGEMKSAVEKELIKLASLIVSAKNNRQKQTKAMQRLMGGQTSKTDANVKAGSFIETSRNGVGVSASARSGGGTSINEEMIYNTFECQREYSTLRAPSRIDMTETKYREGNFVFVWSIKMLERSLRKILYWLGDEEETKKRFDDVADKIK